MSSSAIHAALPQLPNEEAGAYQRRIHCQTLGKRCALKRTDLRHKASRMSKAQTGLTLTASVLSLLAAGSITAVLANVTTALGVQIFAALTAFSSGVISALLNVKYKPEKIFEIFEGANSYLQLREEIEQLITRILDEKDSARISKQYSETDSRYQNYVDSHID